MSHTADAHSKYALPKFKSAASSQKRNQKLALAGAGLVVVWMMALGAVAYKRHADAEAATQAALQVRAAQEAIALAAQHSVAAPASAPVAAPAVAPSAPVAVAAAAPTKPASTSHHRSHSSPRSKTRTLAARSTSSSKAVATASPSAKRMKDDQLDALLKQFK
ncbi:MAG: hypothetical protein SF187_15470 [Deltaproteobacteria bacterium]|nr:hypothetical protein [Deltaproteobacteria bacterium]